MSGTFSTRSRDVTTLGGHVESVFDSSANLRFEGALWNATIRRDALHPQGILIPEAVLRAIEVGLSARLSSSLFEVGPIRLEAGPSIEEPVLPSCVDLDAVTDNLSRLDRRLRLFGRPSIVRATLIEGANPATASRVQTLLDQDAPLAGWHPLIGGGEGSTPAWDDCLTGVILADRLLGGGRFLDALPESLRARTTELSVLQLEWALEGRSALVVEELLVGFATRPLPASLLARCIGLGHSSGSDILTGILAALKVWCGRRPRPTAVDSAA